MDFEFGDFKSSDSDGNKTKYAKQIIDNVAGRIEKGKKTKVKNEKGELKALYQTSLEGVEFLCL